MSQNGSYSQRSRSGCLTCRTKRKKCDEKRPSCSRCTRTSNRCIWPGQSEQDTDSRTSDSTPNEMDSGDVFLSFPCSSGKTGSTAYPSGPDINQPTSQQSTSLLNGSLFRGNSGSNVWELNTGSPWGHSLKAGTALNLLHPTLPSWSIARQSISARPTNDDISGVSSRSLTYNRALGTRMWEYSQDFGPRILWPSRDVGDGDDYDPEGVMPLIRRSITTLRISEDPVFQEIINFYSIFLARYISNYAFVSDVLFSRVRRRFAASDSLKHGMIGTALLFRANYEGSPFTDSLRSRSKEQYQLGIRALRLELESDYLSPLVKIAGLVELMNYEYCAGYLSAYYHHLDQAAALVRTVMGNSAIDFLNLTGEQTFDVRCIAWYDTLSSMALARPTLLDYDPNGRDLSSLPRRDDVLELDRGVEWLFGCPDVLIVLVARISTLRHARLSPEERTTRGIEIEQLVRSVQFRPVQAKTSTLRVARLAAQEACRHAAILYIHHAIFKSDASHPIVRDSVKTMIRIASILKPGFNPDCFIPVPYFIAGTFAESERDRRFLRSRVLSCGNERFLRNLAATLDELWKETDATGRLANWSGKHPPTFVF
ncbi:fungal-specific transcription factor domain-containing protein [Rhizoctonia solani]|nr:fungal-specific transcription factor domain-containing protein [Rhizoctonia solani]